MNYEQILTNLSGVVLPESSLGSAYSSWIKNKLNQLDAGIAYIMGDEGSEASDTIFLSSGILKLSDLRTAIEENLPTVPIIAFSDPQSTQELDVDDVLENIGSIRDSLICTDAAIKACLSEGSESTADVLARFNTNYEAASGAVSSRASAYFDMCNQVLQQNCRPLEKISSLIYKLQPKADVDQTDPFASEATTMTGVNPVIGLIGGIPYDKVGDWLVNAEQNVRAAVNTFVGLCSDGIQWLGSKIKKGFNILTNPFDIQTQPVFINFGIDNAYTKVVVPMTGDVPVKVRELTDYLVSKHYGELLNLSTVGATYYLRGVLADPDRHDTQVLFIYIQHQISSGAETFYQEIADETNSSAVGDFDTLSMLIRSNLGPYEITDATSESDLWRAAYYTRKLMYFGLRLLHPDTVSTAARPYSEVTPPQNLIDAFVYGDGDGYNGQINNLTWAKNFSTGSVDPATDIYFSSSKWQLLLFMLDIVHDLLINGNSSNFVPYFFSTSVQPGLFYIKTDQDNMNAAKELLKGVATVATTIALSIVGLKAVKAIKTKSLVTYSQLRRMQMDPNANPTDLYKLNRKYTRLSKLSGNFPNNIAAQSTGDTTAHLQNIKDRIG